MGEGEEWRVSGVGKELWRGAKRGEKGAKKASSPSKNKEGEVIKEEKVEAGGEDGGM